MREPGVMVCADICYRQQTRLRFIDGNLMKSWDQLLCLLLNSIIWPSNKVTSVCTLPENAGTSCPQLVAVFTRHVTYWCIDRRVCQKVPVLQISSQVALLEEWDVSQATIRKMVMSTCRQCSTLHEANGGHGLLRSVNLDNQPYCLLLTVLLLTQDFCFYIDVNACKLKPLYW